METFETNDRRVQWKDLVANGGEIRLLSNSIVTHRYLLGEKPELCRLQAVHFEHVGFYQCEFEGLQFLDVTFRQCDFSHMQFRHCYFSASAFEACSFQGVLFEGCVFFETPQLLGEESVQRVGCLVADAKSAPTDRDLPAVKAEVPGDPKAPPPVEKRAEDRFSRIERT